MLNLSQQANEVSKTVVLCRAILIAVILTATSYGIATLAGWEYTTNWLEVFAVATSYACTYLCVVQSRLNYPLGLVTTIAYAFLFWEYELYGLAATNVYLPIALTVGWFLWGPDGNTRPVTNLRFDAWLLVYAGFVAITWYGTVEFVHQLDAAFPDREISIAPLDAAVLGLTILAQYLLDTKKLQTWFVWVVINVLTIYLTWGALPLVALQYVFFLGNTIWGYRAWRASAALARFDAMFGNAGWMRPGWDDMDRQANEILEEEDARILEELRSMHRT